MIDPELLKNLIPLHNLTVGNLERLAKRLQVEKLPTGRVIFNEGDTDNDAIIEAVRRYLSWNLIRQCEPSQKGLYFDAPHRHSV